MWIIRERDGMWQVADGDRVESAWATESQAQVRAHRVNEEFADAPPDGEAENQGRAFYAVLCVEGVPTEDGRYLEVGGWNADARILPLPFMFVDENQGGHYGAVAVGTIETMQRMADGRRIFASGHLSTTEEAGTAEAQIESRTVRFVSIDMGACDVDEEVRAIDEDGYPAEWLARFDTYTIMGATCCPFPALPLSVIWLDGMDSPDELTAPLPAPMPKATELPVVSDGDAPEEAVIIIAASGAPGAPSCTLTEHCGGPALPPADWFERPDFQMATPLTVTREGRIMGHIGRWGEKYRGDLNVTIPRSPSAYAQFMTGQTAVACCAEPDCGHESTFIRTGVITLGGSHASTNKPLTVAAVRKHYEDTGLGVADVVAGEDEFGVWVSGALRMGIDDARVRQLLGSAPSGDWRPVGGALDLVAIMCVNMPGFPVFAHAHVDDEKVTALVASGFATVEGEMPSDTVTLPREQFQSYLDRLELAEAQLALLAPQIADRIAAELGR